MNNYNYQIISGNVLTASNRNPDNGFDTSHSEGYTN